MSRALSGFLSLSSALLTGVMSVGGRTGAPPDSCKFVTVAEVTELIGKPVGGGQVSVVDNPKSLTSSCMYTVNRMPTVIVMVAEYPSTAAAKQEFAGQLDNATDHRAEPGVGDNAFWSSRDGLSITAVQGQRLATMAIVGGTAALHDRLHSLMVKALAR
jgi:hypothetical protein